MAKIRPLQTTQLQIVVHHFLTNKHSIVIQILRADLHFPKNPNKKAEVIQGLATKYKLRINLQENQGTCREELNENEKNWLIEFLSRSDITYTYSGRKDHVYIDKFNSEKKYKQRQYLPWPLRDILSLANSNADKEESFETKFGKELTFSQLYDFLTSQEVYIQP